MRRMVWLIGLLALPVAGCIEYDDANNARSVAYLIDSQAQIPDARSKASAECLKYNRQAGLYNITQFQHVLVVFDCRPAGDVRFEVKPIGPTAPAS